MRTKKIILATALLSTVFVACRKEITEPTNADVELTSTESITPAALTVANDGTVRYSKTEAAVILDEYRNMSFDELSTKFTNDGTLFNFSEIAGKTSGAFVEMDPNFTQSVGTSELTKFIDERSRWAGKNFLTPFGDENVGSGINMFNNKLILKTAFRFKTYNINSIPFDGKPCLYLDYSGTVVSGITDYLRKVEDGVFLGQVYTKTPGTNKLKLMGYFTLVALEKTSQ